MRILGVDERNGVAFDHLLAHGENPTEAGLQYGYRTVRPLTVRRIESDLELSLAVEEAPAQPVRLSRRPHRDADLVLGRAEKPRLHQRIAAYGVVTSALGVLATEYSDRTAAVGRWGLPGGGIDAGEDPAAAVLREIVEETNQTVDLGELIGVHSGHWIGRSPAGDVEDFHAVRLIYTADCPHPTTARVLDVGGTTASARWVSLADWTSLPWTAGWRDLLRSWLTVS